MADSFLRRASRWRNGVRGGFYSSLLKKRIRGYRKKYCLSCNTPLSPNSPTQLRCGPPLDKGSCAYKALKEFWRDRERKRRNGEIPISEETKQYQKEYQKFYRKSNKEYYKNWRLKNKEKCRIYAKKFHLKNPNYRKIYDSKRRVPRNPQGPIAASEIAVS